MAVRFLFDECADEDVATALMHRGLDVLTITTAGRKGLSDEQQLLYARQDNRAVYTTDHHFLVLAQDWLARGEPFPGIVYHAQGARSKREIIDSLVLLDAVCEMSDMQNRVEFI